MPNIDELVDGISQIIAERKARDVYFTTLDFTYAYGLFSLEQKTNVQCHFSLVGGKSTGTYRFKNNFYGLPSMPAEFQKFIDNYPNCVQGNKSRAYCISGKNIEEVERLKRFFETKEMRICKNRV